MMQILPRWRVELHFPNGRFVKLRISDSHASNVLRKVADVDFSEGSEQPTSVSIQLESPVPSDVVLTTGSSTVRCSCGSTAVCPIHSVPMTHTVSEAHHG